MEVESLIANALVLSSNRSTSTTATVASTCFSSKNALCSAQCSLAVPEMSRIMNRLTIRKDCEFLEAEVDACRPSNNPLLGSIPNVTDDAHEPSTSRIPPYFHILDGTTQLPMELETYPS